MLSELFEAHHQDTVQLINRTLRIDVLLQSAQGIKRRPISLRKTMNKRMAHFNLLGKHPLEFFQQGADPGRAPARVTPERLIPAPDCGMKYLARDTAFGKLRALSDGARVVRSEL